MAKAKTKQQLALENDELRARLQELEDTLEAIRSGAVDAIVTSGPAGDRVFTLEGADHAYHVMVETMNEGAVSLSTDGTILYGNRRFAQMAAASPSGIVGRRFHEFVHTFDHPILDTILDKAGLDCPTVEITLFSESAAEIPIQIAASPIELGGAKALTLVITDLSAQRRYEEIVAAESLSRRILEQAQEAIAVCVDGCIVRANRALYEICGSVPLTQPFDLVFPLQMSESETFSIAMPESGRTIRNQEVRYQRTDGKIFDMILSAGPLVGQANKVLGSLVSLVNITERKQAEEELRRNREQILLQLEEIETIYDSTPVGLCVFDRDLRYRRINERLAEINGIPAADHLGKTVRDIVPELADQAEALAARIVAKGKPVLNVEFSGTTAAQPGVLRTWVEHWLPLKDAGGTVIGIQVAGEEITERKQAEEALQEANETLEQRVRERTMELRNLTEQLEKSRHHLRDLASELVMAEERERKRIAGVLHDEIAQTLAAARMRLDLLQGIAPDQQDQQTLKEAKALLVESINETRALMMDIGNPVLYDMGLKAACEALTERLMGRHPIRIRCDIRDAYKRLDPDINTILFQLIRELLNNVVKHSHAQNAYVAIDLENGHFRVKVTDDGVGFDIRTLGAPTIEGGFGLYSIRERLIVMDGSLSIESVPGTGTTVTAVLPAALT